MANDLYKRIIEYVSRDCNASEKFSRLEIAFKDYSFAVASNDMNRFPKEEVIKYRNLLEEAASGFNQYANKAGIEIPEKADIISDMFIHKFCNRAR